MSKLFLIIMVSGTLSNNRFSRTLAFAAGCSLLLVGILYATAVFSMPDAAMGRAQIRQAYAQSLALFPSGRVRAAQAIYLLAEARADRASWQESAEALEASLRYRSQDPLGWGRLAYVHGQRGEYDKIGPALRDSVRTGPHMPGFMIWRFLMFLEYWEHLDAGARSDGAAQALRIWKSKPNDFIRLARMPALASQIETLMNDFYPEEMPEFLQRRRPLRHTR